jgi:hypothetical protein
MPYTPTSTIGVQMELMRHLFANSAALRTRMGVDTVDEALTRIRFESPLQQDPTQPATLSLPDVTLLLPTQTANVISGGVQARHWPSADYQVHLPFWPHADYHFTRPPLSQDEMLEALDFAGTVFDEIRNHQGLTEATLGDTTYGLPELTSDSRMDLYDSLTQEVANDLTHLGIEYQYFYFAVYQLRVQP